MGKIKKIWAIGYDDGNMTEWKPFGKKAFHTEDGAVLFLRKFFNGEGIDEDRDNYFIFQKCSICGGLLESRHKCG